MRTFFIQPYAVSSSQMETTLLEGDRVLVDKTAYGIRMPITLLSMPFTFDRILGLKSYSDLLTFNYYRFNPKKVSKNDIVLLNNPLEEEKPIDKRNLLLSRCVAVAGDTIFLKGHDFFINGKEYIPSPDVLMDFSFPSTFQDSLVSVLKMFNIPDRIRDLDSLVSNISLNKYELFIVSQKLPISTQLKPVSSPEIFYTLSIPKKGMPIVLDSINSSLYVKCIRQENPVGDIIFKNGQIFEKGSPLKNYIFKEDYYWFISDNLENSVDSRSIGFVSEKYVIGKAFFVWYSSANDGVNYERLFKKVI